MLDAVPLLAVTTVLIGVFLHIFANLQLANIRANWNTMRCNPLVIPIAHLVPDGKDPTINPTEFSADNFKFCMTQLIDASIALSMAPIMGIFHQQVQAMNPIGQSMNYLRASATSLLQPLTEAFAKMFKKIMIIGYEIARIYQKLHSSFDRILGIAVSSIFAGLSMYKSIQNLLKFVILVIIIILTILIILMVFAFFLLFPVMPVIITTLAVISASVFGSSVGGMADAFCVFPGTLVAVPGGWKRVEDLHPGDSLREGFVEGVLKTSARGAECVAIGSLRISASHLILDTFDETWKPAKNHTLATLYCEKEPEFLYCVNTSTRKWVVCGELYDNEYTLRDWEELSGDDLAWENMVFSLLNKKPNSLPRVSRPGRGLLSSHTQVYDRNKGPVSICNVSIGDFVKDSYTRYTEVLGTYKDSSEILPRSGPNFAVWIWNADLEIWEHPESVKSDGSSLGYHLITKSGIFMIDGEEFVRDFTEVGADRIHETYSFVKDFSIHW